MERPKGQPKELDPQGTMDKANREHGFPLNKRVRQQTKMLLGINNHEMIPKEEEKVKGGHSNQKLQVLTQMPNLRPKTH